MTCVVTEAKWTCDRAGCKTTTTTSTNLAAPSGWVQTRSGDVCAKCAGIDYLHLIKARGLSDDEIRKAQDDHRPI